MSKNAIWAILLGIVVLSAVTSVHAAPEPGTLGLLIPGLLIMCLPRSAVSLLNLL